MKKIAISQSNYIPWRGYFDLINSVDEFVFFDEVQYTRRDWRNRNKIIINNKEKWLTVPVNSKGNYKQPISKIEVFDSLCFQKHLEIIRHNYQKAEYFNDVFEKIEELFNSINLQNLSKINQYLIIEICKLIDIQTLFHDSKNIMKNFEFENPNDKLLNICNHLKCNHYYTGPSAKNYIDEKKFNSNNIEIIWLDYGKDKKYKQFSNNFIERLSIIDCLMHCGFNANKFLNTVN